MVDGAGEGSQSEKLLAGILAMLVAARDDGAVDAADRRKTEVILRGAGLSAQDIAAATGKSLAAVRKTIQRAG